MIHLQAHYHTILTFGTKYKSLYRNDHTIYTNTLNIHLFGIFLVRTVSQEARSLTNPQFLSSMIGLRTSASPGVAGLTRRPSDWYLRVKITRGFLFLSGGGAFRTHPSVRTTSVPRTWRSRPPSSTWLTCWGSSSSCWPVSVWPLPWRSPRGSCCLSMGREKRTTKSRGFHYKCCRILMLICRDLHVLTCMLKLVKNLLYFRWESIAATWVFDYVLEVYQYFSFAICIVLLTWKQYMHKRKHGDTFTSICFVRFSVVSYTKFIWNCWIIKSCYFIRSLSI